MALDIVEQAALTSGLLIVASGLAVWLLRTRLAARKALESGGSARIERARRVERSDGPPARAGRPGARAQLWVGRDRMTVRMARARSVEHIAYIDVGRATLERVGRRDVLRFEVGDADWAWEWTLSPAETARLATWFAHVGIEIERLRSR